MTTYSFVKNMYAKNFLFFILLECFTLILLSSNVQAPFALAQGAQLQASQVSKHSMVVIPAGEFSMGSPSW
ncbi:MAG: hypothetical protein ACPGYT_14140, partial [Nitrospirales bacterium]